MLKVGAIITSLPKKFAENVEKMRRCLITGQFEVGKKHF
jgi:hypothetical protein